MTTAKKTAATLAITLARCPACHGTGKQWWNLQDGLCPTCTGAGRLEQTAAEQAAGRLAERVADHLLARGDWRAEEPLTRGRFDAAAAYWNDRCEHLAHYMLAMRDRERSIRILDALPAFLRGIVLEHGRRLRNIERVIAHGAKQTA